MKEDNIKNKFINNLPPRKIIHVKNEIDYYGIKQYIYKKCDKRIAGRSFVSWRHGWYYYKKFIDIRLLNNTNQYCLKHLVHNERVYKYYTDAGFNNTELVGMPYIYIDQGNKIIEKIPNSLLIMPSHNTHFTAGEKQISDTQFIEKVYEISKDFNFTVVVLYGSDYETSKEFFKPYRDRITIIEGANNLDANSLLKMHYIFNSFENLLTNAIGSHVLYGAYSNCKVSIDKECYISHDIDVLRQKDPFYTAFPKILDFVMEQNEVSVLENEYPFLFKDLNSVVVNKKWADEEIGVKHKREYNEMWRLLENNSGEKTKAYLLTLYKFLTSKEKTNIINSKIRYLRNKFL